MYCFRIKDHFGIKTPLALTVDGHNSEVQLLTLMHYKLKIVYEDHPWNQQNMVTKVISELKSVSRLQIFQKLVPRVLCFTLPHCAVD